jgi:hypothetical protein
MGFLAEHGQIGLFLEWRTGQLFFFLFSVLHILFHLFMAAELEALIDAALGTK